MLNTGEKETNMYAFQINPELSAEEKLELRSQLESAPLLASDNMNAAILQGQYRISYKLLTQIFKLKTSIKKNGSRINSSREMAYRITKMELLLLILLLQMCDSENKIQDFLYSKDIEPLKDYYDEPLFKKSTFYYAINSLEAKKIIQRTKLNNGAEQISIPANHIGKKERYVTLQTDFLIHDSLNYLRFRDMKLGSMKLYLFCLANTYKGRDASGKAILNGNPELHVSEIKNKLGVRQNRTIHAYINCLENTFGKLSFHSGYGKKKFENGKLQFFNNKNRSCFSKRTSLSPVQTTSYRRHFNSVVKRHNISFTQKDYLRIRDWLFSLLNYRKDISIEQSFAYAMNQFICHGSLDNLIFNEISYVIVNA